MDEPDLRQGPVAGTVKTVMNSRIQTNKIHLFKTNILIFTMPSACFEPECTSSGRRLYVPVLYNYIGTYNRLPEDVPSDSKHVEDIVKIKILIKQRRILLL